MLEGGTFYYWRALESTCPANKGLLARPNNRRCRLFTIDERKDSPAAINDTLPGAHLHDKSAEVHL
ncbi:MAG: hypothetical protein JWQ34_3386 [Mucilaginibacter sp.]|nr:hypothetical protein [Mucilaginibacter sp.]